MGTVAQESVTKVMAGLVSYICSCDLSAASRWKTRGYSINRDIPGFCHLE